MKKQTETIMRSAEKRLDAALQSFRDQAFGNEDYHAEAVKVATMEAASRYDTPPDPNVRRRLIRNWAWWKRMGR